MGDPATLADPALASALATILAAARAGGAAGGKDENGGVAPTADNAGPDPDLVPALRSLRDAVARGGAGVAAALVTAGAPAALVSLCLRFGDARDGSSSTGGGGGGGGGGGSATPCPPRPRPGLVAAQALANLATSGRAGAAGVWGGSGPASLGAIVARGGVALTGPAARAAAACVLSGGWGATVEGAVSLVPPFLATLGAAWAETVSAGDGNALAAADPGSLPSSSSVDTAAADVATFLGALCLGEGRLGAVLAAAGACPSPTPGLGAREAVLRLLGHWVAEGRPLVRRRVGSEEGAGAGGDATSAPSSQTQTPAAFASALVAALAAAGPSGPAGEYEAALHLVREVAARPDGGAGLVSEGGGGGDAAAALVSGGGVEALLASLRRLGPPAVDRPPAAVAAPLSNTAAATPAAAASGAGAAPPGTTTTAPAAARPALYPAEWADTAAALANLLHRRPAAAAAVVADPGGGGPATILAQCQVERWGGGGGGGGGSGQAAASALPPPGLGPAFAREWALWAVRNLCEASPAAAAALDSLTPVAGVDTPELVAAGLRVEVDVGTGKVRTVKR